MDAAKLIRRQQGPGRQPARASRRRFARVVKGGSAIYNEKWIKAGKKTIRELMEEDSRGLLRDQDGRVSFNIKQWKARA